MLSWTGGRWRTCRGSVSGVRAKAHAHHGNRTGPVSPLKPPQRVATSKNDVPFPPRWSRSPFALVRRQTRRSALSKSDGLWAPANTRLNVGREEQVRRAQPRQALWACGLPECHGGWNRFPCLKYFSLAGNRRTNVEIMSTTRVVRGTRSRVSICLLSGVHLLGRAFDKLGSSSALFATDSASQNRAWRVVGSHELCVEAMILHEAPCLARKG